MVIGNPILRMKNNYIVGSQMKYPWKTKARSKGYTQHQHASIHDAVPLNSAVSSSFSFTCEPFPRIKLSMRESYPVTQHLSGILPLCLVLLFITATIGTSEAVVPFFRSYRAAHPDITHMMRLLTDWGNPALYIVYGGILTFARKRRDPKLTRFVLAYIAVQLTVSFILVRILKISLGRPRPGVEGLYMPWSFDAAHNSLPSGHTTEIIGGVIPLTYFFKTTAIPLLLGCYAALVGFSRIYLEMHHISDVFFGILLGSFSAYVIHTIWNRD